MEVNQNVELLRKILLKSRREKLVAWIRMVSEKLERKGPQAKYI